MRRKSCIPPEVKQRADEAARRLDDAIDALLGAIQDYLPSEDQFHRDMVQLIDADKNVIQMRRR